MEICSVTLRDKNKANLCRIFVVPGGDSALLGMPDIEILGILSGKCSTIEPERQLRDQTNKAKTIRLVQTFK